jgi:hypothetical protein
MAEVKRIAPPIAREKIAAGAHLVCAYASDELCQRNQLAGALSLQNFEAKVLPAMDKSQEVIFYCA